MGGWAWVCRSVLVSCLPPEHWMSPQLGRSGECTAVDRPRANGRPVAASTNQGRRPPGGLQPTGCLSPGLSPDSTRSLDTRHPAPAYLRWPTLAATNEPLSAVRHVGPAAFIASVIGTSCPSESVCRPPRHTPTDPRKGKAAPERKRWAGEEAPWQELGPAAPFNHSSSSSGILRRINARAGRCTRTRRPSWRH